MADIGSLKINHIRYPVRYTTYYNDSDDSLIYEDEFELESRISNTSHKKKTKKRSKKKKLTKSLTKPFKYFQHISRNEYPDSPEAFFESSKEVGLYFDDNLFIGHKIVGNLINLEDRISKIAYSSPSKERYYSEPYIGIDLFRGYQNFKSISSKLLNSLTPCFSYIEDCLENGNYNIDKRFVFISVRHNIVNLIMSIFNSNRNESLTLNCNVVNNKYVILGDASPPNSERNTALDRFVYSGYAFEDAMKEERGVDIFFSVVENQLNEDITLLLRCEMDAYNSRTKNYTELKCFGPLKLGNKFHREKLLKTWVQTSVIPKSDILIGIRDNYYGLLQSLHWYSRRTLYKRLSSNDLPQFPKEFNYNANIAVDWSKYAFCTIAEILGEFMDSTKYKQKGSPSQHSFQIKIDSKKNITIKEHFGKMPENVRLPENFRNIYYDCPFS